MLSFTVEQVPSEIIILQSEAQIVISWRAPFPRPDGGYRVTAGQVSARVADGTGHLFENLPPGPQTFQVRSLSATKLPSAAAEKRFTVMGELSFNICVK